MKPTFLLALALCLLVYLAFPEDNSTNEKCCSNAYHLFRHIRNLLQSLSSAIFNVYINIYVAVAKSFCFLNFFRPFVNFFSVIPKDELLYAWR